MRRHLILLVSAVGLALGGAALPLTAAHAATGAFATIDASVDGQVSGTFTSDAGRANVELRGPDGTISDLQSYSPTAGVPTSFSASALSLDPGTTATLTLKECDADGSNCVTTDERPVTLPDAGPLTVAAEPADASPLVAAEHPESSIRVTLGNTADRVGHVRMYVEWLDANGWTIAAFPDTEVELPQPSATYDVRFMPKYMSSGVHRLRLTVRGPRPGQVASTQEFTVEVVNPAPQIASFTQSAASVYPTVDGYRDTVRFTMKPAVFDPADAVSLEIEDALVGGAVRTLTPVSASAAGGYVFVWDGRHEDGTALWAGPFHVRVTLRDTVARAPEVTASLSVSVVRKHLETRSWRKTVSAAGSKVAQSVGRCSRLRSPSLHGWAGSLGLYSNTRCHDTVTASRVSTTHRIAVPAATVYGNPVIEVYGGSPRLRSTDTALLRSRIGSSLWTSLAEARSSVGWYGRSTDAAAISKDRTLTWALQVSRGKRWDAKCFRIRMAYRVLVAD